ncbi:MAG: type II toxin-antitoxin system VapC family toxin [Rhodoferax sp.]
MLFDSSALYKRYQLEPGRDQVLQLGQLADEVVVAAHCRTEIASVLNRQRHDGFLAEPDYDRMMREVDVEFDDFYIMPLDKRVEAFAIAAMRRARLRAMDALHIGTAMAVGIDLFVTADKRQAQVAQMVGLTTELIAA